MCILCEEGLLEEHSEACRYIYRYMYMYIYIYIYVSPA